MTASPFPPGSPPLPGSPAPAASPDRPGPATPPGFPPSAGAGPLRDPDASARASGRLADLAIGIPAFDPTRLSLEAARAFLGRLVSEPLATEGVALADGLGRILAADLVSPIDVPGCDNAAMDGYALSGSSIAATGPTTLAITGTTLAGPVAADDGAALGPGQSRRIMTGAALPPGADTVVAQERVEVSDGRLVIPAGAVSPGANRRRAGEDLARGQVAVAAGTRLGPAELGLIASLGETGIEVRRRLRVGWLSTGSELRPAGSPLPPGCRHDSNGPALRALLTDLGFEPIDFGLVDDTPAALAAVLAEAAVRCDAVLTTGGVGAGDADPVRRVLEGAGDAMFWSLACRPGRPFAIARLEAAGAGPSVPLFGLPGNPVAALVVFSVLVRDALLALAGARPLPLPRITTRSAAALPKRPGRTEYVRARLVSDASGHWVATPTPDQGSGILSSLAIADGLIELGPERGPVAAGEAVDFLPLRGLF